MTQADSVLSTPPTNTPIDTTRRRFLTVAAGASVASVGTLAVAAMPAIGIPMTEPVCAVDPAFALIAEYHAAQIIHGNAIDANERAAKEYGHGSEEAWDAADHSAAACHAVDVVCWKLANTSPTTLAGVAAVLRFANQVEDEGGDWPETDTIGPRGWHYQLRASMAAAVEAIVKGGLS
jgi:hypothetical protein